MRCVRARARVRVCACVCVCVRVCCTFPSSAQSLVPTEQSPWPEQSPGDCIHDALGVVHAKVERFSYDETADGIDLSYRLLFRSHTITLSKER